MQKHDYYIYLAYTTKNPNKPMYNEVAVFSKDSRFDETREWEFFLPYRLQHKPHQHVSPDSKNIIFHTVLRMWFRGFERPRHNVKAYKHDLLCFDVIHQTTNDEGELHYVVVEPSESEIASVVDDYIPDSCKRLNQTDITYIIDENVQCDIRELSHTV